MGIWLLAACHPDNALIYQSSVKLKVQNATDGPEACGGDDVSKVGEETMVRVRADIDWKGDEIRGTWMVNGQAAGTANIQQCSSGEDCASFAVLTYPSALPGVAETITLQLEVASGNSTVSIADNVSVYTDQVPQVQIYAPFDGQTLWGGDPNVLVAAVADAEDCSDQLSVALESDLDGPIGSAAADDSGVAQFDLSGLSDGTHMLTCTVTDSLGQTSSTSVTVEVTPQELCNGLDDDGDGVIPTDEADNDGDGVRLCDGDCNDQSSDIHPGAEDVCDGVDNDCDGDVDEELGTALEVLNGVDDDCDGTVDHIPLSTVDLSFTGEAADDMSSWSITSVGDVDGDGLGDILVGAFGSDRGECEAGAVYLFLGSSLATYSTNTALHLADADAILAGDEVGEAGGWDVAGAGDVNGDGLDDFLVGAYDNDNYLYDAGKTYLFLGRATWSDMLLSQADVTYVGEKTEDQSGTKLAGAGDFNGDGLADFLIGAWGNDDAGKETGKAYLFFGRSDIASVAEQSVAAADAMFTGEVPGDFAASDLAGAGDVNGDGYDDILLSGGNNDEGAHDAGKIYLFLGGRSYGSGTSYSMGDADEMYLGVDAYDYTGKSVSSAGDVNGDGLADFLIEAVAYNDTDLLRGKAYLILGDRNFGDGGTVSLANSDYTFLGESELDRAGMQVAGLGNIDGDGLGDFIIGAPYAHTVMEGQSYIIRGMQMSSFTRYSSIDLSLAGGMLWGENADDYSGYSVSSAGDVNGDGLNDVLVGAWGYGSGSTEYTGRTYLVLSYF